MAANAAKPASGQFWASYMAIANKVKRRFMRKPNYGEAALDFAQLKAQMRRDKFPQYAAFCALAVARCEQALGRTNQEVAQYTDAARLFAQAEVEQQTFVFAADGSTVGFEENYIEALDCYRLAIESYLKWGNFMQAMLLYEELASLQEVLGRLDEAIANQRAILTLQARHQLGPLMRLHTYKTILSYELRLKRHAAAIATAEELAQFLQVERSQRWPDATPHGLDVYATEIRSAEILRWLLRLSEGHDMNELRADLGRLCGVPDFATSDGTALPPPPQARPGATAVPVQLSTDVADLLDGILAASHARELTRLVELEAIAAEHYLNAEQAAVLAGWVDSLQTAI